MYDIEEMVFLHLCDIICKIFRVILLSVILNLCFKYYISLKILKHYGFTYTYTEIMSRYGEDGNVNANKY